MPPMPAEGETKEHLRDSIMMEVRKLNNNEK